MDISLTLSSGEIETIRSWYEYANEDSFHYGGGTLLLPSDQLLLQKLKQSCDKPVTLTPFELEILTDWMDKATGGRGGDEKYLFGFEQLVFEKITAAEQALASS